MNKVCFEDNRCICCGEVIPDGRQVCWKCEHNKKICITDIESLFKDYKTDVDNLIDKVYFQNKPSMDYLRVDKDEFVDMANLIIVENFEKFKEAIQFNQEDEDPFVLLRTILDRKLKTFVRDQNREKRKANLDTISFQSKVFKEDDDTTIEDVFVDKIMVEEINNDGNRIYEYLKRLSEKQKSILILKLSGVDDVISAMGISRAEYNREMDSLSMDSKIDFLYRRSLIQN